MGRSESPPSLSTRFVTFAGRYHRFARDSLPAVVGVPPGAWEFGVRSPGPHCRWRRRGLPSSWGTLVVIVRALRPRQDQARSVGPGVTCLTRPPPLSTTKAPGVLSFRGSITRSLTWLSTLRRVGRPTTTQDSLLAAGPALPGGIGYPQGSSERFPSSRLFLLSTGLLGARTVPAMKLIEL